MNGEIFNVGTENHSVSKLSEIVKEVMGQDVKVKQVITNDNRSYHISSKKIKELIGFDTKYEIEDAVNDLKSAFQEKKLLNTFDNSEYFNIKKMQSINLK
jgi:nucleoside-diphosphate-sugar epimerase